MNKSQPVVIDGITYTLDITAALKVGALVEEYPLNPGDVYVRSGDSSTNPLLLVQTKYTDEGAAYQLHGRGCDVNRDDFFYVPSHTKDEIRQFLRTNKMVFQKNIDREVRELVGTN